MRDPDLDWSDERDFEDARRGFIARLEEPRIRNASGRAVWDLTCFGFLEEETAPPTVNPSLWRQARLNMIHGLFRIHDHIYQVRGHDLSVISFIEGETGYIVIDPLISAETARASLELVRQHVGERPVVAVIYTHSHVDHFGGAEGVVSREDVGSGRVPVVAPEGFLAAALSENVLAGNAMLRRAGYMYGGLLPRDAKGQVDAGLGKATSQGTVGLIEPTDSITETGATRVLDGVEIVFQLTPDTEAPAEMNFYFPQFRVLCMAENCSHNQHNLYTLRGAQVRDALAWARYLQEAIDLFAAHSTMAFTSHHWPVWGKDRVLEYLKKQRDMYRYLHDQTLRLANHGLTMLEIAEQLSLPPSLEREWYNRSYYGSVSHNSKAVYQRYLGFYDGNPAHLHPLPPEEAGAKYVELAGGAEALLRQAREAFERGEYRWAAQLTDHLVFADPANREARELEADALEQLGYQAESAPWRNAYLTGALELRQWRSGAERRAGRLSGAGMVRAMDLGSLLDLVAMRLDGPAAEGKRIHLGVELTDTGQQAELTVENSVLHHGIREGDASDAARAAPDATIVTTRSALEDIVAGEAAVEDRITGGEIRIEGDPSKVAELFSLLDDFDRWFPIVTPKMR